MQSWLVPLAALLVGGGGIGTLLGLVVQRQNNKSTATATAVAQAIDGLVKLDERKSFELARAYARIDELEAETAAERKTRRGKTT